MIDIHCHLLPQIDDGSQSVMDTLELFKEACNAGFTKIITTSHYISDGRFVTNSYARQKLINAFQEILNEQKIDLELYNGAEAYLSMDLPELYENGTIPTLANSRYVLFELPMSQKTLYVENIINKLEELGYIPIIAHPERYDYVKENINEALKWVDMGAYLQCNYGSIMGQYGGHAKKTIVKLFKENAVTFLGTDTHRVNTNYTNLKYAINEIKERIGAERFYKLSNENPEKIIKNETIYRT